MKRREALLTGLGLVGFAGLAGWETLISKATAQPPSCTLVPQQAAGPFYFNANQMRRNISERRPGIALKLDLQIVDANTCSPIKGALVDIWHADAAGVYSGFARQGDDRNIDATSEDFMRGTQVANAEGRVEFITVYPGWYPGRTPHIHFHVLSGRETAVTSQLYFPDAFNSNIYERAPYTQRGGNDTTNENDGLLRSGGLDSLQMAVAVEGEGYKASHRIGIAGGTTSVDPSSWGWLKSASS